MKKNLMVRIGAIVMVLMVAFFSILPDLVSAEGDEEPQAEETVVAEEEGALSEEITDNADGIPETTETVEPEPGMDPSGPEVVAPEPGTDPVAPAEGENNSGEDISQPETPDVPDSTEEPTETETPEENPSDTKPEEKLPDKENPGENNPGQEEIPEPGTENSGDAAEPAPGTAVPDTEVVADAGEKDTIDDYLTILDEDGNLDAKGAGLVSRLTSGFDLEALADLFDNDEDDFEIEGTTLVRYTGTDAYVAIPERVTAIGDGAFSGNTAILAVGFPGNLQSIGGSAFNGCSNLVSVSIPDSVTSVGAAAFANCTALAEVYPGAGAGIISQNEFANCVSLQGIAVPEGISGVAAGAFSGCSNLGSISLPSTIASLDASAFSGDVNLASISVASGSYSSYDGCVYTADGSQLLLCPQGKTGISFAPGTRSVASGAFSGCNYLLAAVIPDAAGSIETNAFSGSAIKAVTIPTAVTSIGSQAGWTPNVVYGYSGSTAERWAYESNYVFESLDQATNGGSTPNEEHIEDGDSGDGGSDPQEDPGSSNPGSSTPRVNLGSSGTGTAATAAISRNSGSRVVSSTPKTGVEDYGIFFLCGGIFLAGIAFWAYSRKLRLDRNK